MLKRFAAIRISGRIKNSKIAAYLLLLANSLKIERNDALGTYRHFITKAAMTYKEYIATKSLQQICLSLS
jgi:hypothetical protein